MNDVRLIAFYLPQFHPIQENDEWWGKGFTEWTNVSSAKPVFPGHYQPHIPADLGFYDLRMAEVREEQAKLARNYGIHGFCYYYYYFNGKRLLNEPLDQVLASGKPDFPFCICWANENWTRRWDGKADDILIEQVHTPESDLGFIKELLPVLQDKRYIRVNNKSLVLVYRAELLPDPQKTAGIWRDYIRKETGEELYLCAVNFFKKEIDPFLIGFDGVVQFPLAFNTDSYIDVHLFAALNSIDFQEVKDNNFLNYPSVINYLVNLAKPDFPFYRGVFPSWDNTPRRQNAGSIFLNSSPELYKLYLKAIIGLTRAEYSGDEQLVFINAWNEWAEGAHLEPDKKFGLQFLEATKEALTETFDQRLLMEEINDTDAESRRFYTAARHLTKEIATSDGKITQLTQQIEKQHAQFEAQLSGLTRRIEEQEKQIQQLNKLLEQKELLIHEKESMVQQKELLIHEKENMAHQKELHVQKQENRIAETERLFHDQVDQQLFLKSHARDLEFKIVQNERQIAETENRIEQLAAEISRKDKVVSDQNFTILEKDELLQKKDHLISETESVIAARDRVIQEKIELLAQQEMKIKSIDKVLQEKDVVNISVSRQLRNALHSINVKEMALQEKIRFIDSLYHSFSWKITRPIRWFHAFLFKVFYLLFPYQSKRWRVMKRIVHPTFKDQGLIKPVESFPDSNLKIIKKKTDLSDSEKKAIKIIKESKLFDSSWYLENYPDIKKVGVDPIFHFVRHGYLERRKPNPLFDTKWYSMKYKEVIGSDTNPLIHYIGHGDKEGFDPNPLFDGQWYLQQYPDVLEAGMISLAHYLLYGAPEKRNLLKPDLPSTLAVKNIKTVAVICHVYYPELWDELSISIRNIPISYELYVSIPKDHDEALMKNILADFPSANVKIIDNLGADVFPFILFLEEIMSKGHQVFCKIHTKKGKTGFRDIWRSVLLSGTLGSQSLVIDILNAFDADERLAIAGSEMLFKSAKVHEYGNRSYTEQVYALLYPNEALPEDWGFFAGTMFWGRTSTFLPLARVILKRFKFEQERLGTDGQLAHTIERMIGAVVSHDGYNIGLVNNELGITRSRSLQILAAPGDPSCEMLDITLSRLQAMYLRAFAEKEIRDLPVEKLDKDQALEGGGRNDSGRHTILLCAHSIGNHLAGGEFSFLDMVSGLKNNGFNLIVVLPKYNKDYVALLYGSVVKFYFIPYTFWGVLDENKSLVQKVTKIIKKESISAVYVNTIMIREPLKAARVKGVPAITHVRELISGDDVLTAQIRKSKDAIQQEVIERTDFIIANSQANAAFFNKTGATFIIPNTIDVNVFDIPNNVDLKNIKVGLISSNIPKKGIYEFVEVARICEERLPNVSFLLIGEENNYIKDLMHNKVKHGVPGNLVFAGYSRNPLEAVSMVNIVVNLSLFSESFGRTVLEAMAARRPVVAYDYGAISELIENGKNGDLVPFRDVATAAEKVTELCRDLRKIVAMGEYGRKIAVKRYSKESYNQSMGKVMKEILLGWPQKREVKHGAVTVSGETEKVRVSVVIPNYNYSRYLQDRIESIASQTYPPFEIIFLDDASTDDSVEVAKALLKKGAIPYRIITNAINQGTYRQWLKGIEESTGEYVWIAEADDSCTDRFLEKLTRKMITGNAVLGYCQSMRIDGAGSLLAPDNLHHTDDLSKDRWRQDFTGTGVREVVDYLCYRNSIPNVSACLFKKSGLQAIPEELTGYRYIGDWYLYCSLLSKGSITYLAEPLNKFRRHENSVTRVQGKSNEYLKELLKIKRYIVNVFPVHPSQIEKMVDFLNRDFKIDDIKKNSDHHLAVKFIKEIRTRIAGRKRMVFLTTNNGSYYGGSEQLWIETAVQMRKQNHDIMVIIKKWDPAPTFFQEFDRLGITVLFKEELDFNDVARFKPDLMVVSTGDQDEGTEWFDLCRKNHIPYIIINQLTKEPKYWPVRKEKVIPVKNGYLGAEKVFFTCNNNHEVMERRLDCKLPNFSIHYNPFHFDRNSFVPFPSMVDGLKLAIPANLLRIHKGQHLALELFNTKKWKERPVYLNLYGKGADEEVLKKMARDFGLKKVTFYERTPDLLTIWRDNHVIFMPSFMEGLPIVLVGAMICARVPVVTNIGGHQEIVDDGINGFIAREPTLEALDEALERAYQASAAWEEMGKKAREKILAYLPANDPVDDFISKIMPLANKKK